MFFREFIKGSAFAGSIWLSGMAIGMAMEKPTPKPISVPVTSALSLPDSSAEDARDAYKELMLGWWPSQ